MLSNDPALFHAIWSIAMSIMLLMAGGLTLAILPWSDDEIDQVDNAARAFAQALAPLPRRAFQRHNMHHSHAFSVYLGLVSESR